MEQIKDIILNAGGELYNYDYSKWNYKSKGIIVTNSQVCLKEYKNML